MQNYEQNRDPEDTDDNQNDLAGNASGNESDEPTADIPSGIAGTDISGEDSVSQEGREGDDLSQIETDDDDDLEIKD